MIDCDEAAGVFSLRLVGAKISLDFRSRKRRRKKYFCFVLICVFFRQYNFFVSTTRTYTFRVQRTVEIFFFAPFFSLTIRNGLSELMEVGVPGWFTFSLFSLIHSKIHKRRQSTNPQLILSPKLHIKFRIQSKPWFGIWNCSDTIN